jgi:hypothetical protein
MPLFTVEVGVATSRPPKTDRITRIRISAISAYEAEITAILMAEVYPETVMATFSQIIDWDESDIPDS